MQVCVLATFNTNNKSLNLRSVANILWQFYCSICDSFGNIFRFPVLLPLHQSTIKSLLHTQYNQINIYRHKEHIHIHINSSNIHLQYFNNFNISLQHTKAAIKLQLAKKLHSVKLQTHPLPLPLPLPLLYTTHTKIYLDCAIIATLEVRFHTLSFLWCPLTLE